MPMTDVLIVDERKDLHARAVAVGLARKDALAVRLHLDELAATGHARRHRVRTGACRQRLRRRPC